MLYNTPLFGVALTMVAYILASELRRRSEIDIANPLLVSIVLIIGVLKVFEIPLEAYQVGGNWVSFLIKPATVALAIPLYYHYEILMKNLKAVMIGISGGVILSLFSVAFMGRIFGLTEDLQASLMSKSITTPIGIEVTKQLGGIVPLAIAAIIITGVLGALIGPGLLKLLKIKDKTACGIALGTSAHVIGTSKAIEMNEEVGAMSAVAIPIAGILTVILAPLVMAFF
tara:strand:- start:402 stop:1085 length:684 start_codon:yes stop_codon:yes gene_type:complete